MAAGLVLGEVTPAWATQHTVQTVVNGGHLLLARGSEYEGSGSWAGLEYWYDFRSSETTPIWDTVCAYQGYMAEFAPGGRTVVFTQYSSYHSGCSFLIGFFDWPNWESWYREDTVFRAKWLSDNTAGGGWQTIGDLQD